MSPSKVGWCWLAVGWLSLVGGLVWLFGPVGLLVGGVAALLLGALIVDWEVVARGEPARAANTRR